MYEDDDQERPSKTRRKKDMHALQDLGRRLAEADPGVLEKLTLPETLRAAIEEYRRLPNAREARRRQMQFIGRLMRDVDGTQIQEVLDRMQQNSEADRRRLHQLEEWREQLIEGGDAVLQALVNEHPTIEVQTLRQLIRQARRERDDGRPPAASRKLFRYLRELIGEE